MTEAIIIDTPEGIDFVRATTLMFAAALTVNTGMLPTRGMTKTRMRDMINEYTGANDRTLPKALRTFVNLRKAAEPEWEIPVRVAIAARPAVAERLAWQSPGDIRREMAKAMPSVSSR